MAPFALRPPHRFARSLAADRLKPSATRGALGGPPAPTTFRFPTSNAVRRMKIIDRYVLWTFLKNYLISFMVLVGMYVVLDMVFNFDELVDVKGKADAAGATSALAPILNIVDYYFYQAFMFFVHLSGIIPVVAAAFTLIRLSRFNELTALLAAGTPLLRVAMPIILAGVVLNALMIADQELILPRMIPKLTRGHEQMHAGDGAGARSFQIHAMQDQNGWLLHAARYTPAGEGRPPTMEHLSVIEQTPIRQGVPRPAEDDESIAPAGPVARASAMNGATALITADRAVWNGAGWELTNGRRITNLGPTDEPSETTTIERYESNVNPEEIALYRSGDWVEMLSTARIEELIQRPGSYGQASLLRVKHWRFTQPVMNVILLLLAIPCVLTREPGRLKNGVTRCLILAGGAMGSVFLAHQLAGKPPPGLSPEVLQIWPALMAWLPIFLFGPLSVYLLDRVKT